MVPSLTYLEGILEEFLERKNKKLHEEPSEHLFKRITDTMQKIHGGPWDFILPNGYRNIMQIDESDAFEL